MLLSYQLAEPALAPGILVDEATPFAPKLLSWLILSLPFTQVQLVPSHFQMSFKYPKGNGYVDMPPNNQLVPDVSVHPLANLLAPGVLLDAAMPNEP